MEGWVCLDCGATFENRTELCDACGVPVMPSAAMFRTGLADAKETPVPEPVRDAGDVPRQNFEDFEILEEIGAGGSAVVFRAWEKQTGRYVALKLLKLDREDHVLRFMREAHATTRLSHPNVVKIHRTGRFEGKHFIAMELIKGKTLAGLIENTEGVPPRSLVVLFLSVCRAVRHAHEQGIIHRDLKPANILVNDDGHPFVVDFGLSRVSEPGWTVTLDRQAVGTPQFMSPEQARGEEGAQKPATDIYSLGAVFYFILTGRPPFLGKTPIEVMDQVRERDPDRPRSINPQINPDLETICLKCLQKEPARRYLDVRELEEDIRRWLDDRPILARPASWVYRLRRFMGRRRLVVIPTVAALLLVAAFGIIEWNRTSDRENRIASTLARAREQEGLGKLEEARRAYRDVLQLDPDHPDSKAGEARTHRILEGRKKAARLIDEARPALESVILSGYDRDVVPDRLREKLVSLQTTYAEAVRLAPDLASTHFMLGRACDLLGLTPDAERHWRQAVKLDPDFASARFHLGRLLVRRAFLHSMRHPSLDHEPDPLAEKLAAEGDEHILASSRSGGLTDEPLHLALGKAMRAYVAKEHGTVRALFEEQTAGRGKARGTEDFYWLRGLISKDRNVQISWFTQALEIRPTFMLALFCRAVTRQQLNLDEEAERDFDRVLRFHPEFRGVHVFRGAIRAARGDRNSALADFNEAVRLDPDSLTAYMNRCALYFREKNFEAALEDINEALRLRSDNAIALQNRGAIYAGLKRHKEAVADYSAALNLQPKNVHLFNNRGVSLIQLDRCKEAVLDFSRALELEPDFAKALVNRGNARLELREYTRALEDLDRAVELDPDLVSGHLHRGRALRSLRRWAEAVKEFDIVLRERTADYQSYHFRGECHAGLGDKGKAHADFLMSLKHAPQDWTLRAHVAEELENSKD